MVSKVIILALVAACLIFAEAAASPFTSRLKRCRCIQTIDAIDPRDIKLVKILPQRTSCDKLEIIVIKNGKKLCLNPNSAMGRKLVGFFHFKMKNPQG
ncbi:C-X-C motif chemokine 2-like [Callorhinchus milii]|uniref:C-X-C motif chemokine 2-like n=1 Tax=Callorhinchus milii TaxID=7868 RepID=UPI0004575AD3|nr:C-X-C motif chemokine 2-like [Callorhinchus milii]|eukprot:gi/632966719/ref/XP_007899572.1/ PREDICTED: C-X-C motif chemokine 2-like [Callorhinchus milii]